MFIFRNSYNFEYLEVRKETHLDAYDLHILVEWKQRNTIQLQIISAYLTSLEKKKGNSFGGI